MEANPYESSAAVLHKRRFSARLLVTAGIGCGLLMLLCCGGFATISLLTGKYSQKRATMDPNEIRSFTKAIAALDIPSFLQPQSGVQITVSGDVTQTGVVYLSQDNADSLTIGQVAESDGADSRRQLDALLAGAGIPREELLIQQSTRVERKINGETTSFTVSKGSGEVSQNEYWRIRGEFRGRNGRALLFCQTRADAWSEQQIEQFILSIE